MFEIAVLFVMLSPAEPARAIDDVGIQQFIDSQRTANDGPGKIIAQGGGYFDDDQYPDRLIVYTFDPGPSPGDGARGLFAVAFLTAHFDRTDIVPVPEAELIPESIREYSYRDRELVLRGKKRLPGDKQCCPSGVAVVTLTVRDGKIAVTGKPNRQ